MDTVGRRIRWALQHSGKSATDLAKKLGITRSAVSQWWSKNDATAPSPSRIERIADFTGANFEWLRSGSGLPFADPTTLQPSQSGPRLLQRGQKQQIYTLGEVGAGMFLPVQEFSDLSFEREPSVFPQDPRYPIEYQYDLIVRGTSIDLFASDGKRVRCVNIHAPGIEIGSGDFVHVERYRFGRSQVENTIKRVKQVGSRMELHFYSRDPRWEHQKPLILGNNDDTQVEIVGKAIYEWSAPPNGRR